MNINLIDQDLAWKDERGDKLQANQWGQQSDLDIKRDCFTK